MRRRLLYRLILSGIFAMVNAHPAVALNELTHKIINEQTARRSGLDQVLKNQMGFPGGIEELVRGRQVLEWIGEGGIREDAGIRFFRHFHDPLEPWDRAGLRLLSGLVQFDSSVRWMQRGDQEESWQDARRYYLTALTAETAPEREQAFAETFRALGQIMHLVVDASVPEHVRNDPHPLRPPYGNYEYWVSDQHGPSGSLTEGAFITNFLSTPISFDPSILQQPTGDAQASVPVGRLIDADLYTGADPNVTLQAAIGIAEVANANFFSEDTTEPGTYPFPDVSRLQPSLHPALKTGRVRAYYAKGVGDGLPADPVLAECVLDEAAKAEGVFDTTTYRCVDENVWTQTAQAMLPRGVRYSAALLDYFFRGQLQVFPSWDEDGIWLEIHNRSREEMEGIFELYAVRGEEQERIATLGSSTEPIFVGAFDSSFVSAPDSVAAIRPAARFLLVFRGRQGEERPDGARGILGAVAGVVFDLEYVFTVQETFEGLMEQQQCASGRRLDPYEVIGEHLNCSWGPRTVRITGRFVINQERPIIQRVELFGEGRLIIDGVEQPDGQWLRRDPAQPDPRTFVVEQGAGDLEVTTNNGTLFETSLAEMDGSSGVIKRIAIGHPTVDSTEYLVHAGRSVNLDLDMEDDIDDDEWTLAVFRARQISGFANPTPFTREWVWPERKPGIYWLFAEGVKVDDDDYIQAVVDTFETFPDKDLAQARYDQLAAVRDIGDPILEPGAPEVTWRATVERFYRPVERSFFRLFGITPPAYTIELRGQ